MGKVPLFCRQGFEVQKNYWPVPSLPHKAPSPRQSGTGRVFSAQELSPPPSAWRFRLGRLQPAESSAAAVWVAPKTQSAAFRLMTRSSALLRRGTSPWHARLRLAASKPKLPKSTCVRLAPSRELQPWCELEVVGKHCLPRANLLKAGALF